MEVVDNKKGKEHTLEDDKGPKELILRSKTGTYALLPILNLKSADLVEKPHFTQTKNMEFGGLQLRRKRSLYGRRNISIN